MPIIKKKKKEEKEKEKKEGEKEGGVILKEGEGITVTPEGEVVEYKEEVEEEQKAITGYDVLASLFGEDYVQKLLEARKKGKLAKLGDPIGAIRSVLEEIKEKPELPVAAIVNTPFWVALVEVPVNKEVFIKQTSVGNWRIGVLCGQAWVSLFSSNFEDLEKLEGGELYFVIVDSYKEREWNGMPTWSGNLLYAIKVTDFFEQIKQAESA